MCEVLNSCNVDAYVGTKNVTYVSYISSTSKKSHEPATSHISVISKALTQFWRSLNVISCAMILLVIEWVNLLQASNPLKITRKPQDPLK